jgi:hypothetical protein
MKVTQFLGFMSVVVVLSACASTGVMRLSQEVFPAKPIGCTIEVFNTTPKVSFIEIARVSARSGQTIFEGKGLDSMLPDMKKAACKLGADGLILNNVQEGGYNFVGPADRGSASGVAIKFN